MPKKIREPITLLKQAGFVDRGGKGSHRNFMRPSGVGVTLSGGFGNDALPYQEKEVKARIEESQQ